MTKRMLADILWEAANERLSKSCWYEPGKSHWSCNAVAKASFDDGDAICKELSPQSMKRSRSIFRYLWRLCVAAVLFVFIAAWLLHRVHVI